MNLLGGHEIFQEEDGGCEIYKDKSEMAEANIVCVKIERYWKSCSKWKAKRRKHLEQPIGTTHKKTTRQKPNK